MNSESLFLKWGAVRVIGMCHHHGGYTQSNIIPGGHVGASDGDGGSDGGSDKRGNRLWLQWLL